ncbi:MAG: hypothetical protein ACK4ND_02405 [Cytophagaceae bacterium]
MLDYCKMILEKVSFDKTLFEKEYQKFKKWLPENQTGELEKWRQEHYGSLFSNNPFTKIKTNHR